MQDRQTSDVCVHECVIRQLFRLPRSCMRVAKGTRLVELTKFRLTVQAAEELHARSKGY